MMNKNIDRFKLCDTRFHPFVRRVIERLPDTVRQKVMNDRSFQIITGDDVFDGRALRYEFGHPVKSLAYLNSKILMEPDYQIIHTIASEIAHYLLKREGTRVEAEKIDELLIEWEFGKEVEAVRCDLAISESKRYRTGYEWAKKQSKDYLMQQFGLYFDAWSLEGLGRMSSEGYNKLDPLAQTDSVLDAILKLKSGEFSEAEKENTSEASSQGKAMLAGIMAALKELMMRDLYDPKNCSTRYT